MTKLHAISKAKSFRMLLDEILQGMKAHKFELCSPNCTVKENGNVVRSEPLWSKDEAEVIAQHTLSIRDLESAIMRQGMVLKNIGNENPYPNSYNPDSPVVDKTADGLKL